MDPERGPLEQEIYDMTRADLPPGPGSMETGEMVVILLGHMNKIEEALLRLAREIEGSSASASDSN